MGEKKYQETFMTGIYSWHKWVGLEREERSRNKCMLPVWMGLEVTKAKAFADLLSRYYSLSSSILVIAI